MERIKTFEELKLWNDMIFVNVPQIARPHYAGVTPWLIIEPSGAHLHVPSYAVTADEPPVPVGSATQPGGGFSSPGRDFAI